MLLFHRKYQNTINTDAMLQSGLISALYSFARQVVDDEMDYLQMKKVSLLFNRQNQFIFVLFIDNNINPVFCEKHFRVVQEKFFKAFPEVLWNKEVVNTSLFKSFKQEIDKIFMPLESQLGLYTLLIEENIVKEDEIINSDLEDLGRLAAVRLLQRNQSYLLEAKAHGRRNLINEIDDLLSYLGLKNFKRDQSDYTLDCNSCKMCEKIANCFYEGFISTLVDKFNLMVSIRKNVHDEAFKRAKNVSV